MAEIRMVISAFLFLFGMLVLSWANSTATTPHQHLGPHQGSFLLLSDIHLDALTGTDPHVAEKLIASPAKQWPSILRSTASDRISPNGADTNFELLASAIKAMKLSGIEYDYILITGDFLGHNYLDKYLKFRPRGAGYREFAIKTIVFTNQMLQEAFPSTPIYEVLGNNDSVESDYGPAGEPLLSALSREWKSVASNSDATRDFLAGGYYALPHPFVPSQELIALNTGFWSTKYEGASQNASDPGTRELTWLKSKLDRLRATKKTAALLMHIPLGVDAYKSSQAADCHSPTLFWKKAYQDSFLEILQDHKSQLRDGYAGHIHMDDFVVISDTNGTPYFQTHIIPSISRDHRNNPAFEIGTYDKETGALVDYAATYLRTSAEETDAAVPARWELEYDFRGISHFPSYGPPALQTIALMIRSNDVIRKQFLDLYAAHAASNLALPTAHWLSYSCAQTELDTDRFSRCACPPPAPLN